MNLDWTSHSQCGMMTSIAIHNIREINMSELEKAETINASQLGAGKLRPGTLQLTVNQSVTRASLHDIVDAIIHLHGCAPCGLGGLDILIRQQDPRLTEAFKKIPAVADVSFHQ